MTDTDKALYIKFKGREWCVWLSPADELIAIPVDEKVTSENELQALTEYLCEEGFFLDYYSRQLNEEVE